MNTVLLNKRCDNLGKILKAYREKIDFTQSAVAKKAGISTSMLSQIERSAVSPSIETLYMVCDALGLDIAHLFSTLKGGRNVRIHHDGERLRTESNGISYEQLVLSGDSLHPIEMFLIKVEPKQTIGLSQHGHEGIEMGYVLSGTASLIINNNEYVLRKGDSVSFNSSLPHRLKNTGNAIFQAVWNALPPHKDYLDIKE